MADEDNKPDAEEPDPDQLELPMGDEPEAEEKVEADPEEPLVLAAKPPPSSELKEPERPLHIDTLTANERLDKHAPRGKPKKARKPFTFWGSVWWSVKALFLITVVIPVALVLIFKFVPPPTTILMVQGAFKGRGIDYHWRPLNKISPTLVSAAIASEDGKFCSHRGFDFEAIEKAMNNNARGRKVRGGSTISQQTAKNVFLWPQRDWVRKGAETWFTVLIETIWGKKRIMEVYLNVAEMGPGVYGAQAAAQKYFKTDASKLTTAQSARLIAVLPSPIRYKVAKPGKYVARRSGKVAAAAGMVRREGFAGCVLK